MHADTAQDLDHFLLFGEVYDAIEACDHLDTLLARLKRQQLLPLEDCTESREHVQVVRQRLQEHVTSHDLTPRGPRLP